MPEAQDTARKTAKTAAIAGKMPVLYLFIIPFFQPPSGDVK
jgi:hypothetical protein